MSSLNAEAVYEELVSVRLVGMMLTIIVRQELRKNVIHVETQTVTSGLLYKYLVLFYLMIAIYWLKLCRNAMRNRLRAFLFLIIQGNKGGVGVSIQINEASICFINSHLAAHVSEVDRRKEDHDEIVQRMHFGHARRSIDDHEYERTSVFYRYCNHNCNC